MNAKTVGISEGVALTANNNVDIRSGVAEISIDGSGGETNIWAKTGAVNLGKIADSGEPGLLKITAGTDAGIASASLQKDLEIQVGGVLTTGSMEAGSIRASGLGGHQTLDFQGELSSTSGEILVQKAEQVTFSKNATAATDLKVENIGQTVRLGSSANLKAANGNVTFSGDSATLDLVGDPGTTNSIVAMGQGAKGNITLLKVTDSQDANGLVLSAQGSSVDTGQIDIGGDLRVTVDADGNEVGTIRLDEASANDIEISGGADQNDRIEIVRASTDGEDISADGNLIFRNLATVDLEGDVRLKAARDVQANDNVGQIFLSGESGTTNRIEATDGSVTVAAKITDHSSPDKLTIKAGKTVDLAEVDISGILEIIGGEGVKLHGNVSSDGGFKSTGGTFDFTGASLTTSDSAITIDHAGQVSLSGVLSSGAGDIHVDSNQRIEILKTGGIQTTTGSVFLGRNRGGEIGLGANVSTEGGDVFFYRDTELTEDIVLDTGTGSGDVLFGGDLTGDGNLVVTLGAGAARFEGIVDIGGLKITANQIDLPTINTDGMQEYKGKISLRGDLISGSGVKLDGPVTLLTAVTVSGGTIEFLHDVTGGQALTLLGSSIAMQETVSVATLLVNASASVLVHDVVTTGDQTYTGTTTVAGNLDADNSIIFNSPVILADNEIEMEAYSDIIFRKTLDGMSAGNQVLRIKSSGGELNFIEQVGSNKKLGGLYVEKAGGGAFFLSTVASEIVDIRNTSKVVFSDGVIAENGFYVESDAFENQAEAEIETQTGPFTIKSTGNVSILSALRSNDGDIAISSEGPDGVVLIDAAMESGKGGVNIFSAGQTIVTENGDIVTGTGDVVFGGEGSGEVFTSGDATTGGGSIIFLGDSNLTGPVVFTTGEGDGDILFAGGLNAANGPGVDLSLVAGSGVVSFQGPVGDRQALASLKIEGAGGVTADSTVVADRIDFANAGDVVLNGDLNASGGFSSQGDAFSSAGKIETADMDVSIQHQGPVVIQGDISTGAGAVDIDATGPDATLNVLAGIYTTTGLVTIDSTGGSVLGETGLVRTETGDILFGQDLSGSLTLYGNIETSGDGGDVVFATPVLVGGDVRIDTGEGAGDVTFQSILDAVAPNRNDSVLRALTVLAGTGNVVFAGRTGGATPLDALTVGPASSVTVQDALDAALVQFIQVETALLNGDIVAANGFSSSGGSFDGERISITTQGADISVEHTEDASFGGSLNSNGGKIRLSAGGEISLADGASLDSSGGEVALAAGKNLTADSSAGISTGGGQLSVETGQALGFGENFSIATQGGAATLASEEDFTVGAGVAVETGGGSLSVVSNANLTIGEAASFHSAGGDLAMESGLDFAAGQGFSLDSGGGVLGVAAGQDMNVGAYSSLDSGNGSLAVRSGRNAAFETGLALASSGGDANIESVDGLTFGDQTVFNSGTGRLSLTAGGDLAAGDQLSLTAEGGDLLVKAEGAMNIGEHASLATGGGELLLQSGGINSIGNSAVLDSGAGQLQILSGESLTAGSNMVVNAEDAAVLLRSKGAMSIGDSSTVGSGKGELQIQSGQSLAAGSDFSVKSESGPVLLSSEGAIDIGNGSTVDSGKGELQIQSGQSLTAGSDFSVKSESGPVLLSSKGAMEIGDRSVVDSGTGELQIQSGQSLAAGSDFSVKSESGPVLLSSEDAMDIGNGSTVDSGTGELKILSGESLAAGSDVSVKSEIGPVLLSSEDAMDIGDRSVVDSGTGELKIMSGGSLAAGSDFSVKSESGPVLLSSEGAMDIGDRSVVDSGTGGLEIRSGESLAAGSDVSVKSKNGPVLLSSEGAMDIGDRSVVDSGTGVLEIRSGENLTAGSEVALTADKDTLLHSEGAMSIGNGTSVETNGGKAEIYAGGSMAMDGKILSGDGDIVLTGKDTVTMTPDSVIDAGGGKISLNSGGAMTVTALQTTYKSSSDQDPAVSLSSRGGIFDAGNDGQGSALDIEAAKGLLEVRSPLGIGTESNPLEISVSSLTVLSDIVDGPLKDMPNAAWTGDGVHGVHGVYLDTAGGLFINDLKTIDGGNVFMTANGTLSVVELAAEDGDVQLTASTIHGKTQDDGADIEAKNIELHATEGAIKVGSIQAASTGKVTLVAELGIESGEGQTGYIRGGEGVFKSLNFGTKNSPLLIDLNSILFEANENVDQSTRVGLFSAAPGSAPGKGQINPLIPLNTYGVVMGYYGSIDTGKIFYFFIGGRNIEAFLLGLSSSTVQEEKLEEMLAALVASDTWEPPPPQDIPEIAMEAVPTPAPSLTERDESFPTLLWYDRNEAVIVPGLSRRNPDWPKLEKSGLQALFDYDPGLRGLL